MVVLELGDCDFMKLTLVPQPQRQEERRPRCCGAFGGPRSRRLGQRKRDEKSGSKQADIVSGP